MTRRAALSLYVLLAALHIAPFWTLSYLPLGDNATHVYNAWVLHGLATNSAPPHIAQAYAIDWQPHPNWTGHAFMAIAMSIVPPLIAEKLFVTLIFLTLFSGAWRFTTAVDARNDVYAFLVFPFTYTQTFAAGFYNYTWSIGIFLIILSVWWRRRDERRATTVIVEALLLLFCYFTHPQATGLACIAIGFLSLATRRWIHLLALIPVAPLLFFFGRSDAAGVGETAGAGINWEALRVLRRLEVMHSFGDAQLQLSTVVAIVFAILTLATLVFSWSGRFSTKATESTPAQRTASNSGVNPRALLLILALLFAAMMFWLPAAAPTRALFLQRNSPFVFLTLAGWFTPRLPRQVVSIVLTLIATANGIINLQWMQRLEPWLVEYVRAHDVIERRTSLLPLAYDRFHSDSMVNVYAHALSYVALEKELVDLSNYEPGTNYFPIIWRAAQVDASQIEWAPRDVDIARYAPLAEYVVTRSMPEDAPQRRDLEQRYWLVHESAELRFYRRRTPLRDHELVLLPLLGTRDRRGGAQGAWWRVRQRITNRDRTPARVVFHHCPAGLPCELSIERTIDIASDERFAFLHVPRGTQLDISTVVERADVERPDLSIAIPAPHEREFRTGGTRLRALDPRKKIGVRVYTISDKPTVPLTIRIAGVGERKIEMPPYGMFEQADLRIDFPNLDRMPSMIDVEIVAPRDARVWAFATEADVEGRTRVVE
jgi:hypothetical protein